MSTFKVRMKTLHVLAVLLSIIGLCSAGNRPLDKPKNIPSTSRNVSLNSNSRRINCRQKCAIGYYRDWNGFFSGRCVPCRCHGHSKQCADRSGRCIDCKHNTEGDHCERCKSGFFGNAAQGTCSPCPCPYTQPSNNFATRCGEINGAFQCMCKPGYTGSRCERCAPGYFGNPLEIGSECRPCQCGHSSSTSCDPLTGQCSNCQDCTNEEPKDTSSDEKCDTCDRCVEALLLDLNKMDSDLYKIKLQLQNANTSTATQHRMNNLDKSIKNTENQLKVYQATVEQHVKRTDDLENDNMNLIQDVLALEEKVEKDSRTTQLLLSSINVTHQRAQDMVTNIEKVLLQILEMLKTMNTLDSSSGTAPKLDEVERMLNEMRNRNFDVERRVADRENQESKILLDRIKNGFVKNIEENKQLASNITDALSLYQTKLMDLQDAINEAANLTQKAENLNGINSISLDNIKNKHGKLNIKQAEVTSLLQMADVTLTNLNNMLRMLDKSQENYEKHGAQLDGALSSLEDKIKKLSNANSKEPIVVSAERHAENLDQLSKQLQRAIEEVNQDSLIQRVVDASDAYEKIINAVDAAEMAANKAANASHIALQAVVKEDLPGQASELKTKSDDIFSTTNGLNSNFKDVSSKLRDATNRLNNAKSKKNELQPGLAPLQAKIQQINRDDVGETLDMAKDAAKEANDTANRVMSKLQPIINDIKNLNRSSENIENATAINIALREAENSVKNLTNTLPDLVKKLKDLSQIQPVNNISKNIGRIRELIDQAREAANKINVAMKFNGNSGVEVRLPDNLDHLKPYTSLLLYLKRPNVLPPRGDAGRRKRQDATNMFVLYLGNKDTSKDYMGMALQGEKLVTVYKLANDEAKIVSEKTVNKESFDIVKFERILQYGSLNYSQVSSTVQKRIDSISSNVTANGDDLLLNLDPKNTVFYVGGFPPSFVPPAALDYPKYKGCIELGVLNEKLISLYNFEQTFNINTTEDRPCQRYKPRGNEGFYFDGTGYALIKLSGYAQNLAIEQTIQTLSKNAVLLYLESKDSSCVLTIEDGRLVFRYDLKSSAPKISQSSVLLNTSNEIVIRIRMLNSKKRTVVIVNGVNAVYVNNTFSQLDFRNYYLGGIPSQIKERLNIPVKTSVRACMKNLKAEERNIDLSNEPIVGVSKGCSESLLLVRTAYFNGSGLLGLPASDLTFPENFHIGFGFATSQLNSLLFSYEKNNFEVFLENGKVIVNILGKVLKSRSSFNDGANHYVSIQRRGNRIYLNVDDMDKQEATIQLGQPGTKGLVYLGGDKNRRNFDGCISNVFLQRNRESPRIENLAFSVEDTGVYLDTCPQQRAPEMLMLKEGRKWNGQETVKTNKNGKNQKVNPDYSTKENTGQESKDCLLPWQPKSVSGAYQFGDSPDSRLEYDFVPESFKERSTFSIDVRTVATEGTIFYVADKSGKSSMILYVSRGRFIFSFTVNEKKLKIKSKAKHNDGKWHTVVFSRENNKGKLIIDGLRTRHASISDSALLKVESPFYLGGLPSGKKRHNRKLHGFQGCLRNFKMDGSELHSPLHTFGVTPCFDGKFKQGVYFSAKGGYVVLDNSFVVGKDFELLFAVRPQSQTGILFHINSSQGNYLSLYMYKGKVTVHVNNGAGDFNTSVTPQSLCDGQWHRIVVIKRNNVVQLDVDTERDHVVGPAASLSTDTADPLYVGGIPDNVQLPHLPTRNPFIGCMGEVVINVKPVSFKKAVAVHGAVSVTRCPVM